jgi:hypothetical protein
MKREEPKIESICEELQSLRIWDGFRRHTHETYYYRWYFEASITRIRCQGSPQRDQTCVQTGPWSQLVCRGAEALGCCDHLKCKFMPRTCLRRPPLLSFNVWLSPSSIADLRRMVLTTLPDLKKGTHSSQLFEELSTAESSVFCANVYRCTIFNHNFVFITICHPNDCSPSLLRCVREGLVQNHESQIYTSPTDSKISVDSNPNLFMSLFGFLGSSGHSLIRARTLPGGYCSISSRNSSKV